jgi:hypothetical protein
MGNSRPDWNVRQQVFDEWRDTRSHTSTATAHDLVPISPVSRN